MLGKKTYIQSLLGQTLQISAQISQKVGLSQITWSEECFCKSEATKTGQQYSTQQSRFKIESKLNYFRLSQLSRSNS
jgi:hypothetical protein